MRPNFTHQYWKSTYLKFFFSIAHFSLQFVFIVVRTVSRQHDHTPWSCNFSLPKMIRLLVNHECSAEHLTKSSKSYQNVNCRTRFGLFSPRIHCTCRTWTKTRFEMARQTRQSLKTDLATKAATCSPLKVGSFSSRSALVAIWLPACRSEPDQMWLDSVHASKTRTDQIRRPSDGKCHRPTRQTDADFKCRSRAWHWRTEAIANDSPLPILLVFPWFLGSTRFSLSLSVSCSFSSRSFSVARFAIASNIRSCHTWSAFVAFVRFFRFILLLIGCRLCSLSKIGLSFVVRPHQTRCFNFLSLSLSLYHILSLFINSSLSRIISILRSPADCSPLSASNNLIEWFGSV